MNQPIVIKAEHLTDQILKITFSDNTEKTIDFKPFLTHKPHKVFEFYSNSVNFKKFKIEKGNLVWGKNWDLVFPTNELYEGVIL